MASDRFPHWASWLATMMFFVEIFITYGALKAPARLCPGWMDSRRLHPHLDGGSMLGFIKLLLWRLYGGLFEDPEWRFASGLFALFA
jgi:hypothetical protein